MSGERDVRRQLRRGLVIPAHPLALTARRTLDERHQRALTRYYLDAGAGGVAVGVHTTQFRVRERGLYRPVLELAMETLRERRGPRAVAVAGVVGRTPQALREARLARDLGYDAALLSLGALRDATTPRLIAHARAVAEVMPVFGFYLQPAVGGRALDADFWRRFCAIENVVAIKVAPFNRYQTLDVVQAVAESGRADEIALYTGNDDNIIGDLVTGFSWDRGTVGPKRSLRFVGGLLGHWAFWTRSAVRYHAACRRAARRGRIPVSLLRLGAQVTAANAAIFDAANGFAGCIPGIHEILRGQGLLAGRWCLDPAERLSPGQRAAIDRVRRAFPALADDAFVARNRARWLR